MICECINQVHNSETAFFTAASARLYSPPSFHGNIINWMRAWCPLDGINPRRDFTPSRLPNVAFSVRYLQRLRSYLYSFGLIVWFPSPFQSLWDTPWFSEFGFAFWMCIKNVKLHKIFPRLQRRDPNFLYCQRLMRFWSEIIGSPNLITLVISHKNGKKNSQNNKYFHFAAKNIFRFGIKYESLLNLCTQ